MTSKTSSPYTQYALLGASTKGNHEEEEEDEGDLNIHRHGSYTNDNDNVSCFYRHQRRIVLLFSLIILSLVIPLILDILNIWDFLGIIPSAPTSSPSSSSSPTQKISSSPTISPLDGKLFFLMDDQLYSPPSNAQNPTPSPSLPSVSFPLPDFSFLLPSPLSDIKYYFSPSICQDAMDVSQRDQKRSYDSTVKLFSSRVASLPNGKKWETNSRRRKLTSPSFPLVKSENLIEGIQMINVTRTVLNSHYFISLTTIPSRFCHLEFTLKSLDTQHVTAVLIHLPLFTLKDKIYQRVRFPYFPFLFEESEDNKHFVNKIKIIFHQFDFGPILKQVGTAMWIKKFFGENSQFQSPFPLSLPPSRPLPSPSNSYVISIDDDAVYHPLMIQEMIYSSSLHPHYILGNMGQNGDYWNFSYSTVNQSLFNPLTMGIVKEREIQRKVNEEKQKQQEKQLKLKQMNLKIRGRWADINPNSYRGCCDVLEGFAGVLSPLSYLPIPLLLHFSSPLFSPFCYVSDDLVLNFVWGAMLSAPRMRISTDRYSTSWTHLPDNGNDDSLSRGRGIKDEMNTTITISVHNKTFHGTVKKNMNPVNVNRNKYQICLEEMRKEKSRMEREI